MGFVMLPNSLKYSEWRKDHATVYVYVMLFLGACWSDCRFEGVSLKRGQIVIRQMDFAKECGVSRQKLRSILERLKREGKITIITTNKFSIVTLLEYDSANTEQPTNNLPTTGEQPTDNRPITTEQPANNQSTLLNKKDNNIKREEPRAAREGLSPDKNFDRFWSAYPRKVSRQQAIKAWCDLAPDDELTERILSSLELDKHCGQWTSDNGIFIPYPANWLKNRRWEDEPSTPSSSEFNRSRNRSYDRNDLLEKVRAQYRDHRDNANAPAAGRNCSFTVEDLRQRACSGYKK